jgi:hypothetical protein
VKRKKREAEEGGREKEGDRDRKTERVTVCQIQGDTETGERDGEKGERETGDGLRKREKELEG